MKHIVVTAIVGGILLLPAYADNMPVSGFTSGQFSNPTEKSTVSGNQWFYNTTDFVRFDGVTLFSGLTPSSFEFGRITLTNRANGPDDEFQANLNLAIHFTGPSGQTVNFSDGLQITATPGKGSSGHGDGLDLAFHGFPDPQTFTVGKEVYTVSLDGFYDSATKNNAPVSSVFVLNDSGGSASAYLWGTVSSGSSPLKADSLRLPASAVPEPGSIFLLATAAAGLLLSLRRKRQA